MIKEELETELAYKESLLKEELQKKEAQRLKEEAQLELEATRDTGKDMTFESASSSTPNVSIIGEW